ncbi:hypothetical protein PM082_008642 [Marasmius tenuissimus]|nr:hypothetical protein PM082_008642 [Marasmius tenuissimus]
MISTARGLTGDVSRAMTAVVAGGNARLLVLHDSQCIRGYGRVSLESDYAACHTAHLNSLPPEVALCRVGTMSVTVVQVVALYSVPTDGYIYFSDSRVGL